MYKIIVIISLLVLNFSVGFAQQQYNASDSGNWLTNSFQLLQPYDKKPKVDDLIMPVKPLNAPEDISDTGVVTNELIFSEDSILNWKNSREYAYTYYLDSLLKNAALSDKSNPSRDYGNGLLNRVLQSGILSVMGWILAISFVLFIIYRLFLAEGVFQSTSPPLPVEAFVEPEWITSNTDFGLLINEALLRGNYRLAVRYQYLKTLQLLHEQQWIVLAPEKTNFQYVHEFTNHQLKKYFAALTLHYEYVWYGEFDIDKALYQKIEDKFISFNQNR